jgi:hypothetical protein
MRFSGRPARPHAAKVEEGFNAGGAGTAAVRAQADPKSNKPTPQTAILFTATPGILQLTVCWVSFL